jgi:ElaB/YqjD/DUF883 family membrane-anchored ribosome-binding protein
MDNQPIQANQNLSDIQRRREQLKAELAQVESDLEGNIDDIKTGIQQKTDPRHWIRKNPGTSLAIAIGIGFLIGSVGRGRSTSGNGNQSSNSLISELKRVALSRGINVAVSSLENYLAQKVASRQDESNT